ncbi:LytR/AlgR family response regulator transcription factor [Labilibaculum antarcticum]|uniref:DNA-binding response regulator n=1 Tax=Labilibaculum antarcticum TaxID=1717717 RepID=A0A1Y1CIQ5_9BACT|nr:LytTR family DNA-binding domain-containing protein [Labilibaculum antarcticum]BAX79161.1 DNA-binding response regulator [Labilibaculum antarcticum]
MILTDKIRSLIFHCNENDIKTVDDLLTVNCEDVIVLGGHTSTDGIGKLLEIHKPDIVFISSNLAQESSFDSILKGERSFEIIFMTENDEFAIQAFKFSALYCISKPFSKKQVMEGIVRFRLKSSHHAFNRLESLFLEKKDNEYRLVLPDAIGFRLVNVNELTRCEADGCYTKFYLIGEERCVVSRPLSSFIDLLPRHLFCRVHNKHLINLNFVKQYVKGRGGHVILQDGSKVEVSERKKKEFIERLKYFAYSFLEA